MKTNKKKILLNTLFWGFTLWFFGYILGFIFFVFIPKDIMGWYIMPLGIIATLWVLLKKIKRESFSCYVGLGIIWMVMAIILDYIFIVKLLNSENYYKIDVYVYYILTFVLPIAIGWWKTKKTKSISQSSDII